MVTDNEPFIRCGDDMVSTREVCVENVFEVVSFVIDCCGTWVVTLYLYVHNL
jgi:hypothetical protein